MSADRLTRLRQVALAALVVAALPAAATDWLDNPLAVPQLDPPAPTRPAASCEADEAGDRQVLTLSAAIQTALCNNVQLRATWAAIRLQAAAQGEARAAYLPRLNASLNRLQSRTLYPGSGMPADTVYGTARNVTLNWRVFDFGVRESSLNQANQLLAAAIASRHAALQRLLADVVGAYFDAVTTQAVRTAREQAAALAQDTLDAAARRESRGAAAGVDVLQARTHQARARLAVQRALADERKARATLAFLMGGSADRAPATLVLPSDLEAPGAQQLDALTHWLDEARQRHPQIAVARAQLEAARARVASTRNEGLPSLDLNYSYYANGYPNQGLSSVNSKVGNLGLMLSIPLFEGFARTYKVRGAQAQVEQNDANLQQVQQQVALEVLRAHADAMSALGNLDTANDLLTAAEALMQSSRRRYDKGVADLTELLSAQSTLAEAQQERIRSIAEWHTARLRLIAATGQISPADAD